MYTKLMISLSLSTVIGLSACSSAPQYSVPASDGAIALINGRAAVQNAPASAPRYLTPGETAANPNLGPAGADLLVPSQLP
ncbi:MAG: hypothetical protein ABJO67_16450 [Pseudoruegeria sp.]